MAKVAKDNRLTTGEAALLYCILGEPDPNDKSKRRYPTIKESINYMMGQLIQSPEEERKEKTTSVTTEQMTLF